MSDTLLPIFVSVWLALAVLGTPFYLSRNIMFKRRFWRAYLVLVGTTFWAFMAWDSGIVGAVLSAPLIGGMTYLTMKNVSFCGCGKTVWGIVFSGRENCPECGAVLPEVDLKGPV